MHKYQIYDTYHDLCVHLSHQVRDLKTKLLQSQQSNSEDQTTKLIVTNLAKKLDKERRKGIIYRCFNAFRVNAGKKFQNLYQQMS